MRSALFSLALLVVASSISAQEQPTGIPPFSSVQSIGIDAINRQNLNVNFSIPIVSSPGRGINFSFPITNDSLLWMRQSTTWTPVVDGLGNPTWGWKDTVPGTIRHTDINEECDSPPPIQWSHHYSNYSYTDPAGTIHDFDVDFYLTATICGFNTGPRTGAANDGSGYFLDATSPTSPKVTAPNGKVITGANWTDSNGNFFSATVVSGSETDWKDSAGHIPLKIVTSAGSIQYQYPDTSGTYQHATLVLTSTNIKTNFACSGVGDYTGTANLPTELDLANGQKYLFTYEPTPAHSGYYTGRIKRVTLPNGGYVEHQYGATNDGINCSDGSATNLTVLVNDGTTTSTWQLTRAQNGSNWNTTLTAPALSYDSGVSNQSVFTFNSSGKETQEKFYQGSTTGTLLRTINTTWSGVVPATQITILEDNQTQNEIETTYDGYGNLTVLKEHDWGTNAPGAVLRTTTTTFLNTSAYLTANIVNRPTRVTISDGTGAIKARTDIAYDESGYINTACPTGITQHNDSAYGCTFTTRGNATTVTTYTDPVTPGGAIAKHSYYDFFGNLVKADLNCCQQKTWTYSATTNYAFPDSVTSGTSAPQLTTSATYNSFTGLVATASDENGQVTTLAFADPGHLNRISSVTRPDSSQVTYTYDDTNHTVQVASPVQGTNVVRQKTYANGLGQSIKQQLLDASNTSYSIVETQYDTWNRGFKVSNPHNSTAQYWTESRTDAIGRLLKTILQDNSISTAAYSLNTVTTTDPASKQRKSVSDGLGRLSTVYEPDPANGNTLTLSTSYAYNLLDELTTVTQGSQTRTFVYDALGRLLSSTTPEAGRVCMGSVTGTTCNADGYDSFNNLLTKTDARGVQSNYIYDSLNRILGVNYINVPGSVSAMPNICKTTGSGSNNANVCITYGTSSASFNNGRPTALADPTGSEAYIYNNLGQVTQLQKTVGSTQYNLLYAYNLAGELTSVTYPSGRVITQNLDAIGRLSSVVGNLSGTNTTYASGYAYNIAQQTLGFNYGNNINASFGFSADRLQLSCLDYSTTNRSSCAHDGTSKFGLDYAYNAAAANNGLISGITDRVDNGRTSNFSYDALYRLTAASTTGSAQYSAWSLAEVYDRYGNRTQQNQVVGAPPQACLAISTTTNQVTGTCGSNVGFSSDASGNMTGDGLNTLVYDGEGRATSSSATGGSGAYVYDGNSARVKKCVPNCTSPTTTTVYIFSGSKVVAEYVNGAVPASPTREYLYSGATLLAKIESGATKYYHQDHLSNRMVTDSTGAVVSQTGHYPYGESWYNSTNDKLLFTSYERDSESGNDYAMARYYINRLGRFSSPDLLNGSEENPQSLNRYVYVLNNPVSLTDSSGLDHCVDIEGNRNSTDNQAGCEHDGGTWTYEANDCSSGAICALSHGPDKQPDFWINGQPGWYATTDWLAGPPTPHPSYTVAEWDDMHGGGGSFSQIVNDVKDFAHTVVCTATAPLVQVAQTNGGAVGIGAGGSAGLGLVFGVSLQADLKVVADPQGNVGMAFSGGGNPGLGVFGRGALAGIQYSISSASTIFDLGGRSIGGGVSGAIGRVGAGLDVAHSKSADTLTLTVGPGVGGKAAGYAITGTAVPSWLSTNCPYK